MADRVAELLMRRGESLARGEAARGRIFGDAVRNVGFTFANLPGQMQQARAFDQEQQAAQRAQQEEQQLRALFDQPELPTPENANTRGMRTEDRFNREALDWEKTRTFEEDKRLQPFRDMGTQAYGQVGRMLGVSGAPQVGGSFSFATPGAGGRVEIPAPDGTMVRVPVHKVDYYRQKWARMSAGTASAPEAV